MTEKDKLIDNLVEKTGKTKEELNQLISNKVDELAGLVSEEGAIYIIASDLGVRLDSDKPKSDAGEIKIDEINEPKTPVSLSCKVIRKYDKVTFSSKNGGDGQVQSILAGDETGVIRIVFWNDKTELLENVHEGDILKIINAYTRENTNQERIEVHYGQYSDIEVNPEGVKIELKEWTPPQMETIEKSVSELEEGDKNVKISAVVTDFEIPRFYLGCPECFKKVMQDEGVFKCGQHGEVEAMKIPIVNVVIDDSTGLISVVGFRDRAENLCGTNDKEIISLTEDIEKYQNFSKKIIGSKIDVVGNVSINNMTGDKQLIVNQVLGVELKTVDEIADELVSNEDNIKSKNTQNDVEEDLEIEEIDIDDDLL